VRRVVAEEIGRGEGSNFVIRRCYRAAIAGYAVRHALAAFRRLLDLGARRVQVQRPLWRANARRRDPERHMSLSRGTAAVTAVSGMYRYPPGGPSAAGLLRFLADRKEVEELDMVLDEEVKMLGRICGQGARVHGPHLTEMSRLAHTVRTCAAAAPPSSATSTVVGGIGTLLSTTGYRVSRSGVQEIGRTSLRSVCTAVTSASRTGRLPCTATRMSPSSMPWHWPASISQPSACRWQVLRRYRIDDRATAAHSGLAHRFAAVGAAPTWPVQAACARTSASASGSSSRSSQLASAMCTPDSGWSLASGYRGDKKRHGGTGRRKAHPFRKLIRTVLIRVPGSE